MQILSTETFTSIGNLEVVAVIAGIILTAVGLIISIVGASEENWFMALLGAALIVVGPLGAYHLYDVDGTEYVKHQVVITDIDVVIEGGYEIVDMNGKLATIQKPLKEEN